MQLNASNIEEMQYQISSFGIKQPVLYSPKHDGSLKSTLKGINQKFQIAIKFIQTAKA